jgi:signal transduction histidine kinase
VLKIALLILVGILNFVIGLTVLSRNYRKLMNVAFFGLAVGVSGWVLGIAAFFDASTTTAAYGWATFYYVCPLVVFVSTLAFAQVFPTGGKIKRTQFAPFAMAGILLSLFLIIFPHAMLQHLTHHTWGKSFSFNNRVYALYSAYLGAVSVVSIATIARRVRQERGLYRLQARVFFDGYLSSAIIGVFFNLVLPGFGNYRLIWIGPLCSTIYIFAVAYSIVKHKLFNIRLILARSLGYILAMVVLSSVYGFLVFGAAQLIFHVHLRVTIQVTLSAATGLAAFSFQSLKVKFNRATNSIFYRDAYEPQDLFDQLNKVLVSTLDLDKMLKESAVVIGNNLKSSYSVIGVKDGNRAGYRMAGTVEHEFSPSDIAMVRKLTPALRTTVIATDYLPDKYGKLKSILSKNDIALLVRLTQHPTQQEEGIGYLVLGAKKSGNPYSNKDFTILETIANELVIAIQNAVRFEQTERFAETLKERVDVATKQLRRTNRHLEELDSTKDDFISMASHQLRTPLTSVKGYISLVLDGDVGPVNDNQHKLLDQAFRSSEQMVYLISDLLNLSRLNTGKFVIEEAPTDLSNLVNEEIGQLTEAANARNLQLIYDKPAHFPELMLDGTKIRQVVMNFIDNAIYYTPSGGTVTVSLNETPTAVEYTVTDNGIGVPKEVQHRLFSKFYRADNAQKARPDGTGLGLFMAKKVIVAQNGAIIFESQEGKGSTFGFRFNKVDHAVLNKDKHTGPVQSTPR